MKAIGSILIALVVLVLGLWLLLQLFIGVLKLIGVLIAVALAVGAYFLAEKLIGQGR